jgi:hypothetical protein
MIFIWLFRREWFKGGNLSERFIGFLLIGRKRKDFISYDIGIDYDGIVQIYGWIESWDLSNGIDEI